jgi:tight adherence protein C
MPYSVLLGVVVGLSVLFFWIGRRASRTIIVTPDQVSRYLDESAGGAGAAPAVAINAPQPSFAARVLAPSLRNILNGIGALTPSRNAENIIKNLDTAGRPLGLTVLNFLGLKFIAASIGAVLGFLFFAGVLQQSLTLGLLFAVGYGVLGFYVPTFWLNSAIRKRQREILRALPDALDMIVVCTEAGQNFDQAIRRVGVHWHNALTEEFSRILAEVALGRTRHEALTSASDRIQLTEMSNLIAAILQADILGVSIGKVLRVQADQLRTIRRQRAEELARQATVKMLFPLVFLIFPAMFAVLLGPAIPLLVQFLGGGG